MTDDPRRYIFEPMFLAWCANKTNAIAAFTLPAFEKTGDGWIMYGPHSVRGQKRGRTYALECRTLTYRERKRPDLHVRVRVGCRYYSLAQAWRHWGQRKPGQGTVRRNECAQAVTIIRLMLLQAQAYGLLSLYAGQIRFDSTILKPKRK